MATISDNSYKELRLKVSDGYLIFFDNVRVDQFVESWDVQLSCSGGYGQATISMTYVPDLDSVTHSGNASNILRYDTSDPNKQMQSRFYIRDGVENMTNVRIFMKNVFTGYYVQVFEGDIRAKQYSYAQGQKNLVFTAYDYMNWLNRIICPWSLSTTEVASSPQQTVMWNAQGIDTARATTTFTTANEQQGYGQTIHEALRTALAYAFYNNAFLRDTDSVIAWDKALGRLMLMGDIDSGLKMDTIVGYQIQTNATHADSFYQKISQLLNLLTFEFFQDRDGIIRIKPAFWNKDVLRDYVIDSTIIHSFQGTSNWNNFYTRCIAVGANSTTENNTDPTLLGNITSQCSVYPVAVATMNGGLIANAPTVSDETVTTNAQNTTKASNYAFLDDGTAMEIGVPFGEDFTLTKSLSYSKTPEGEGHYGIDIKSASSSGAVNAIAEGEVIASGIHGQGDNQTYYMVVKQPDGKTVTYGNLGSSYCRVGSVIKKGQTIGQEGGHGGEDTTHVHMSVQDSEGKYIDPISYMGLTSAQGTLNESNGTTTYTTSDVDEAASSAESKYSAWEEDRLANSINEDGAPEEETANQGSTGLLGDLGFPVIAYDSDPEMNGQFLLQQNQIEKRYGPLIHNVEQPLIRMSNAASYDFSGVKSQGAQAAASTALVKYANYTLNYLNAAAQTGAVTCVPMPWIRPGFNVWVDPAGIDQIYYVQTVSHSGSGTGCQTSLGLSIGRYSQNFLDGTVSFGARSDSTEDLFISKIMYGPESFGTPVSDYAGIRSQLTQMHRSSNANVFAELKSLYADSSHVIEQYHSRPDAETEIEYQYPVFSHEYGVTDIQNALNTYYASAPTQVKSRAERLKSIIESGEQYLSQMYN